ncbi:MAG: efflux RND transporter permease subunit [SAR324 cluster bacterium]|nr:efflux RND transporter permease subunit [SAR324 cluster bacterium]
MQEKDYKDDSWKGFGPTQYTLKKNKLFWFIFVVSIVFGVSSYNGIPKEWTPDVDIPILIVATPYRGVSPIDAEVLVTRPLETQIQGIEGLESLKSTSTEGVSLITAEFSLNTDLDEAKIEIEDAISRAEPDLPKGAEDSQIIEINLSEFPIYTLNLSSDIALDELKLIADDIKDDLEGISGVLKVQMVGGLEKEMQVLIDPSKLSYYNIGITQIAAAIEKENKTTPAGSIDVNTMKFPVRVPGEVLNAEDLKRIIISAPNEKPIYLSDVAQEVVFGNKDVESISRLKGRDTISLSVSKRAGENLQAIAAESDLIRAKWEEKVGDKVKFSILTDQSVEIDLRINEIINNIIVGFLMVIVVLFLVMGFTNSMLVAVSIPLSMLLGTALLNFFGITLNMVVLFSMIMTLGLVVDDAIVVTENIYRHLQMGRTLPDAIRVGTHEVAYPVITATLTTIASFSPLIFIPGIMGSFLKYLPYTIIATMSSSLVVALFFIPLMCSVMMRSPRKIKNKGYEDEQSFTKDGWFGVYYRPALSWALDHSYTVMFSTVGLFVFLAWFYFSVLNLGSELFPKDEPSEMTISIETPYGTNLTESEFIVNKVEDLIKGYSEHTETILTNIGQDKSGDSVTSKSHISVKLPGWQTRTKKPNDLIVEIEKELNKNENLVPGAKVLLNTTTSGPPIGKPISIEVSGDDLAVLKRISEEIQKLIVDVPHLINLNDNLLLNQSNITVYPIRENMSTYQISTRDLGATVRAAISGKVASTYRLGKEQYDIVVRYPKELRTSIEDIKRIPVATRLGVVPLNVLANIEIGISPGSIRHVNKKRTVTVSADVLGASGANVLSKVQKELVDYQLPVGYSISYGGASEVQNKVEEFLPKAFLATLFLIFFLMAWQFNSISSPIVILGTVFLSLIGVLVGLIIHQNPISIMMGGIGVVSLAGIVAKNGIVLIDYIIYKRNQGIPLREAIITSCLLRVRPIYLTASTAIFALLPVLMGIDINFFRLPNIISFEADSSAIWKPLAGTIAYGLSLSSVLTLVFVPCMYYVIERKSDSPLYKRVYRAVIGLFTRKKIKGAKGFKSFKSFKKFKASE